MVALNALLLSPSNKSWPVSDERVGIEVAWGSRIGQGTIGLNSPWHSDFDDSHPGLLNDYPVKVYDIKQAGNWNAQADSLDMMGDGSQSDYTYHHVR